MLAQRDKLVAAQSLSYRREDRAAPWPLAAQTIRPRWAGERFDLHACVQALFTIKLPEQMKQDQQAA
jgi:hypothetical protein